MRSVETLVVFFVSLAASFPAHAGWSSKRVCGKDSVISAFLTKVGAPMLTRIDNGYGILQTGKQEAPDAQASLEQETTAMLFIATELGVFNGADHYGIFISSPCENKESVSDSGEQLTCFMVASGGATFNKAPGIYKAGGEADREIKEHLGCTERVSYRVLDRVPTLDMYRKKLNFDLKSRKYFQDLEQ
jgi:hypothetical protein